MLIMNPCKSDVSTIIICQLNKLRRKCVKKTNIYFLLKLIVGALSAMWPYWYLSFYLQCDHANGRKHAPKQHLKDAKNLGYVGGYAAAYSYSSKQDAKDSYKTAYGTKEASKDSEMEHKKHVSVFEKLTPIAYLFFFFFCFQ